MGGKVKLRNSNTKLGLPFSNLCSLSWLRNNFPLKQSHEYMHCIYQKEGFLNDTNESQALLLGQFSSKRKNIKCISRENRPPLVLKKKKTKHLF